MSRIVLSAAVAAFTMSGAAMAGAVSANTVLAERHFSTPAARVTAPSEAFADYSKAGERPLFAALAAPERTADHNAAREVLRALPRVRTSYMLHGVEVRLTDIDVAIYSRQPAPFREQAARSTLFQPEYREADLFETPAPAALWLMIAGLAGMGVAMKRKKRN